MWFAVSLLMVGLAAVAGCLAVSYASWGWIAVQIAFSVAAIGSLCMGARR